MSQFAPAFLTIHILTAIVAFGPSFAFPLISSFAAKEPQHGLFAIKLVDLIERRMVLPAALTMPVSGALLVWSEGIDLFRAHWLLAAITLYVVAIVFAFAVQLRTIDRMIETVGRMAPGGAKASPAAAAPAIGGAVPVAGALIPSNFVMAAGPGAQLADPPAGGPPPGSPAAEMAALAVRARNGGIFLSLLVVAIVTLMASKPGF